MSTMTRSAALCLLLALTACAASPPRDADASLYAQLGGAPAVSGLVDAMLAEYRSDPRLAARFDLPAADLAYLRERLVEQLCAATGGGCEYTGLPMSDAHSGMAIDDAEFDAFLEATTRAMTRAGVGEQQQSILATVLERMRGEVVGQ